jgi:hypothetical protein
MTKVNYQFIFMLICFLLSTTHLLAEDKTFQITIESMDLKASEDGTLLGKDEFPLEGTMVTVKYDPDTTSEKVKISGKVTDIDSNSILDATVKTSLKTTTQTNSLGEYTLEEKIGNYDLIVEAIGYKAQVKKISSQDKNALTQNFILEKEEDCFIATAAYGSKLAPEIIHLSRFRDNYLLTNKAGSWFVTQYYAYSPPIADWLREQEVIKFIVRLLLWILIAIVWFFTEASLFYQVFFFIAITYVFYLRVNKKSDSLTNFS